MLEVVQCWCEHSGGSCSPAVRKWTEPPQGSWARTGLRSNHSVRKDMWISSSGFGNLETGTGYAVSSKLIFINFQCCLCKGCFLEDEQECAKFCSALWAAAKKVRVSKNSMVQWKQRWHSGTERSGIALCISLHSHCIQTDFINM